MKRNEYIKPEIKAYEMEATTILSGSGSDDEIGIDNSNSFEDACSNKGFFMEDEN